MATATISAQFTNYLSSDKWQPLHGKMSNLHTDNHLEEKKSSQKNNNQKIDKQKSQKWFSIVGMKNCCRAQRKTCQQMAG